MELGNVVITEPQNNWEFSLQWLIDLFKRILEDVFGFIAKEEGWEEK